jgi:TRAP-type C4-dicarboxylate transport system permease small subunit
VQRIVTILAKADRLLTVILKCITIAIFLVLTAIVSANILLRFFPITSLHWLDEIVEMSFAALVFYGAAGVWMVKGHFSVGDWFGRLAKNERLRNAYRLILELITLLFAAVLLYYSWNLVKRSIEVTSVFQIPKKVLYSCMPASALIMVSYSVVYVIRAVLGVVKPALLANSEPDN